MNDSIFPVAAPAPSPSGSALGGDGARGDRVFPQPPGPRADAPASKPQRHVYGGIDGYTAERLLCDGNYEIRHGFKTSLEAYDWATDPAPGTALEGTHRPIDYDAMLAQLLRTAADGCRDQLEYMGAVATIQERPHLARQVGLALAALADVEEAL